MACVSLDDSDKRYTARATASRTSVAAATRALGASEKACFTPGCHAKPDFACFSTFTLRRFPNFSHPPEQRVDFYSPLSEASMRSLFRQYPARTFSSREGSRQSASLSCPTLSPSILGSPRILPPMRHFAS